MLNNSEMVWDTQIMSMHHDYETGVALSDSINKTCVKCPLAEKLRWRHIRLTIKPCYLGNHASKILSYYGSLSGSHGRSFRILHEKLPEAPPGGEITMTSYPACNKTSSRKPCITHTNLLCIAIRKSCSLFQNPSWKIAWSATWWRTDDDVIYGWQINSYYGSLSCSFGRLVIFIKKTANINSKKLIS